MKETKKNSNLLNLIAFISLVIFAALEILNMLKGIIGFGAVIMNLLNTIKNLGIILVFGITAWNFVANKKKGWKWTYWICLIIFILVTIGLWVFNK